MNKQPWPLEMMIIILFVWLCYHHVKLTLENHCGTLFKHFHLKHNSSLMNHEAMHCSFIQPLHGQHLKQEQLFSCLLFVLWHQLPARELMM